MKRASIPLLVVVAVLALACPPMASAAPAQGASPAAPAIDRPAPLPLDLGAAPAPGEDALARPLFAGVSSAPAPQPAACFQCSPPFYQCLVNNRCSCCLR